MLRQLVIDEPWRSLKSGFWPDTVPAGSRTVVYGHNGSGKSTLAELLLSIAEGQSATGLTWVASDERATAMQAGEAGECSPMSVFTRRWVDANLSAFLDGQSATAIVTLGREAIDAKEQEVTIEDEIRLLGEDALVAEKQLKVAKQSVEKLAKESQDRIISELQGFDYKHFTRNRYSIPTVKQKLTEYKGDFPSADDHAEALRRLAEDEPSTVQPVDAPVTEVVDELGGLPALLADTPTRSALTVLESDPAAQSWVEQGLTLHDNVSECLFCASRVSDERRQQLAQHFDASWIEIRARAKRLLERTSSERKALRSWLTGLPSAVELNGDLQRVYEEAKKAIVGEVDTRVGALEAIEAVLAEKVADPSCSPDSPDWTVLNAALPVTVLSEAVAEHNEQVRRHAEATAERKQVILDFHIGSRNVGFKASSDEANDCEITHQTAIKAVTLAERRLDAIRQEQFTTKDMADALTRDLTRVYGKHHLSVAVTADGKSYACRRGTEAGTDLSDGERTTLSLLYFLRKLEDEHVAGGDPTARIVVIDDPSSSLDREALFATHLWLVETLEKFGQFVVLTHDFGLLRLFLKSQKSGWTKSRKRIDEDDIDEIRFPRVTFLEMFTAEIDGQRGSQLAQLSPLLAKNASEYNYLFSMVMAGALDSHDHERLFLLPNAARRVIEVFASYKAPHRTDLMQQLEVLVDAADGDEPFRDVYDFCNRYSHGEGSETVDVLDARAVHGQVRRCMEFLRAVDPEHFERMCKSVDIDSSGLP